MLRYWTDLRRPLSARVLVYGGGMGAPLAQTTNWAEITLEDGTQRVTTATVLLTIVQPTAATQLSAVLARGLTNNAVNAYVLAGQGAQLPTPPFYLLVTGTTPTETPEWWRVTAIQGDVLTITRQAYLSGTYPAVAHLAGAILRIRAMSETVSGLSVPHVANGVYRVLLPATACPVAAAGYVQTWTVTVPSPAYQLAITQHFTVADS